MIPESLANNAFHSAQLSYIFLFIESMVICGSIMVHFLADFIFYPYKMICSFDEDHKMVIGNAEKRKEDKSRLVKHIISYGVFITLYWIVVSGFLVDFTASPPKEIGTLAALVVFISFLNVGSHAVTDVIISDHRKKAMESQDCEKFWWLMTLDQIIHISTLTITGQYFTHKILYSLIF